MGLELAIDEGRWHSRHQEVTGPWPPTMHALRLGLAQQKRAHAGPAGILMTEVALDRLAYRLVEAVAADRA
jgi:hypothetical protein